MTDQRIEHVEMVLSGVEERLTKRMKEMMVALSIQIQQSRAEYHSSNASSSKKKSIAN
jgi:predicted amidohydrolase YtcJ